MFLQVGRDVPSPSISPQWAQRWKGLSTLKEHLLSYDLLQGSQPCCPHEEQGKSSTPFLGPDGEEPPGARGVRSRWSGQDAFMDKPPQGRAMLPHRTPGCGARVCCLAAMTVRLEEEKGGERQMRRLRQAGG